MGFYPIHKTQVVKTLGTDERAHLGGYRLKRDMELAHIRLVIYKHGTAAGDEKLRLGLYSRADLAGPVALSNWVDVADFAEDDYWTGLVRFDFAREFLDADSIYHLGIEADEYTRGGQAFYLAVVADWPDPVNVPQSGSGYFAAAAHFFGFMEVAS